MTINNRTEVRHLMDMGLERDFLASDEIDDFLPQNIFSSEDIEDAFDFLSESDIDIVETLQEKAGSQEEERTEWGETERLPSERTDQHNMVLFQGYGTHITLKPR